MTDQLDAILNLAFLDTYNIYERALGLATVITEGIRPPFSARVVGAKVHVVDTDIRSTAFLETPVVTCERDGRRYSVDLLDLQDWQHTDGARYIAAYRKFHRLPPWDGQAPKTQSDNIST